MLLHPDVVGVVDIIDADDGMSVADERFGRMRTDETGRTGHKVMSH
jgi:hypothetical protein